MKQIESINRDQLQISSLDMMVEETSMVRVIDAFLDFAESYDLGFRNANQTTGRPSFPQRTLLGIYLYGYLNQMRSSRKLEKACKVNVELMWLVKGHRPCYKTIANFRKDNSKGFRKLFSLYRSFLLDVGLYGKEVLAIDGSKFRGQNSKKNNYNERKIEKHLSYIEEKQSEYLKALDQGDRHQGGEEKIDYQKKLSDLKIRRAKYERLQSQLSQTEETQISTVDPDTRALPLLTPRNWVKYGNFLLNKGKWNGEQIIDSALLEEMYLTTGPNPGHGNFCWLNRLGGYGFQPSDSAPIGSLGGLIYHDGYTEIIGGLGAGKNRMYLIPSLNVVIIRQTLLEDDTFEDSEFLEILLN